MAKDDGLGLDFLTQIVNVHWGGGLHFLYSGADGMFGSRDGDKWEKLNTGAVPATGLAWVDDVWLAIGSGGPWRSEDGGKTWKAAGGPKFTQIAACKASGGIFAGYIQDEEGDHEEVYISRDLGKSWSKALDVPTSIGDDGYETAQILSGCGNGIFLSTIKGDTLFSSGDGCVYAAMDGAFGGRQQIWSGTNKFFGDPDPHSLAYSAGAVGFDSQRRLFCLMCYKQEGFGPGGSEGSLTDYSIIYATGSGGSFSGETEIIKHTRAPLADSYSDVVGGLAAAGGEGKFVGTYHDRFVDVSSLRADLVVAYFDGGSGTQTLITVPNMFSETASAQIGPVCWKPRSKSDMSTDTPTGTGTFACAAFGAQDGGVWIDNGGGGWHKTHNGQGFMDAPPAQRGGLAVGRLSWLGSDNGA